MSLLKQCKTKPERNHYTAPTRVTEYIKLFDFIKPVDKGGITTGKDLESWRLER